MVIKSKRISAKSAARTAAAQEKRAVRDAAKKAASTSDSFQNFSLKLGIGTDNALSGSTYGFNPITRNRTLLEWIHRGSWLGGVAVDVIADDMTRGGVNITSDQTPEQKQKIVFAEQQLGLWNAVRDGVAWSRLYGGAIVVPLIDGQKLNTPLRIETIKKGQLKGFIALDRWVVEPSLEELVDEPGPSLGLPKYYTITGLAPALRGQKVHYSRVMRLVGIQLPYWQAVMENLWGISVYERLYDRMVAFDSATQGAAQSVYKSHLRTYKIKDFREAIAAGGKQEAGVVRFLQYVAKYQGIEGITVLDAEDDFSVNGATNFAGISDALVQFGQQMSGGLQVPLVRLFGQSPAGLNSSGESDLRTYYDGITAKQKTEIGPDVRKFELLIAKSEGVPVDDSFAFEFVSLWQMSEPQKSEVAGRDETSIADAFERGVIDQPTALRELRQVATRTGRFSSITDEMIEDAEKEPLDPMEMQKVLAEAKGAGQQQPGEEGEVEEPTAQKAPKTADAAFASPWLKLAGQDVTIEHRGGEVRAGYRLPPTVAYGYIQRTGSAEGRDEQMDCFVGPLGDNAPIYVIDGHWPDGRFDEHKVMFGFPSAEASRAAYAGYYQDRSPTFITETTPEALGEWLDNGDFGGPFRTFARAILPSQPRLAAE